MTAGATTQQRLEITYQSPYQPRTPYLVEKALDYRVVNISADALLIESLTLQFEPDTDSAPNYVDVSCNLQLAAGAPTVVSVTIKPTPLFLANTNQLQMLFKYRVTAGGRLSEMFTESHKGFYLIVDPPATTCGDVFVSFKQPEDQRLANILERYCRRAGFVPHLFVRHPNIGADQWTTIEGMIKGSHSAFIIWARRTEWGGGVEREVDICRTHHVRELLLIEQGVAIPDAFSGTSIAYKRFDPDEPAQALSDAVVSLHEQVNP